MNDYQEIFLKQRNSLNSFKINLENQIDYLENKIKDNNNKKKELILKSSLLKKKNYLNKIEDIISFLRIPNVDDIEYRKDVLQNFSKDINEIVPNDLPLCFHGCPIYTAKKIIEDKKITSSVDRLGYETSYDVEDQVSVTRCNTIFTTLDGYIDLYANQYCIPAGCIFVIMPKNDEEVESSNSSMLISNVDFNEENRLYGIITTPENIEKVKSWCNNSKISLDKVYTFDSFIKSFKSKKVL